MPSKTILWGLGLLLLALLAYTLFTPAKGKSSDIDNQQLVSIQKEGVPIVDVCTPAEFAGSHIPGSVNVPIEQLPTLSKSWDKNTPVVLYCATGARSSNGASFLAAQGFRKVYNLKQGIVAWTGKVDSGGAPAEQTGGLPTVKTGGKPLFIDFAGST